MFCNHCGTSNPDEARFCSSCGKPTSIASQTPTAAATAAPTPPPQSAEVRNRTIGSNPTAIGSATSGSASLLQSGAHFASRYEIVRLIGRGGMGAVYQANDSVIDEAVALKVLLEELVANDEAVNRFTREAKISRQLSHKHIVRVHDIGMHEGTLYISMEFVEGMNLRRFFDVRKKQTKPLSLKEVMRLARPICEAMEYAHETTVHRDLKPENILVGRDGRVKVSDFGIATLLSFSESRLTSGALGTAYYMAPEQMDSTARIDQRADIYSLGVILYEAVVGKVPVGRFRSPAECREDVPEHLDAAIMKALEPDPESRPESMRQLLDEISGRSVEVKLEGNDGDDGDDGDDAGVYSLSSAAGQAAPGRKKRPGKADPAAAQAALEAGKKMLERGDPDGALDQLNRAVEQNPKLAEAWFFRAQALSKAKLGEGPDEKWQRVSAGKITLNEVQEVAADVVKSFKKAAEIEPENALYKLTATLAEKQSQQNSNILPGTETKQGEAKSGGGLLGGLFGGKGGGGDATGLVTQGNTELNGGNIDGAITTFERAIKRDKKCAAAWYGKGMALGKKLGNGQADVLAKIAQGEMSVEEVQRIGNDAQKCLRQAAKLEPSNALYKMVVSQLKN
ncbi:Serine/threonine-protein kinase StkP [Maioricimonas rarisocia]|uniref:Serine/threonine-protein kinase StkP n=1 Tax=Maioricimonas rarisocia TaxID=2528026 RepID=A0A517ZB13_9PLAN|nr:serine/threonine-protein kinase [Maioricimonas rarisocia]QDU39620.1 Serine/threonine-protein kinase StkP [Maioricimonas rarisocia]